MEKLFIREIFKGNEEAYGTFVSSGEKDERGKAKGFCQTLGLPENKKLSEDDMLWTGHLNGSQSIGVIPINKQHECYWGCIDIDSYDGFDHRQLLLSIKRAKLPLIVFKSKSGGAHVYCFFKNPVKAKALRKKLADASSHLGFKGSEIFPKQIELREGFFGNYVNTPYFGADKTDRYAMILDDKDHVKNLSLVDFYALYQDCVIDALDKFEVRTDTIFPDGPPCNNCIALRGCSEGGRNMYLFNIAVMYNKMYAESGEDWFDKLREANDKYITKPLPPTEVSRIYASVRSHSEGDMNSVTEPGQHLDEETNSSYHYLCKQEPMKSYCNRSECVSRKFGVTRSTDNDGEEFGITQIHKVLDDPIIYYVTFDNGVVMKADMKEMSDQKLWRELVFATLDFKPPRLPGEDFDAILNNNMRDRLEYVRLPEGVSRTDRIRTGIQDWLSGTGQGDDRESLLAGNSFYDEKKKKIYFRFPDLRSALVSTKSIKDTQRDTTMLLDFLKRKNKDDQGNDITNAGLNASSMKLNVKGKTVHVWAIEEILFDLTKDDIEPKEIIKEDAF